jgi:hypothetical protein
MNKTIYYSGNNNENYTLVPSVNSVAIAKIDIDSSNEILLGEDQTRDLVDDINYKIDEYIGDSDNTITIKNDGDCLGIIVDVWNDDELIDTFTFWFDDYYEE